MIEAFRPWIDRLLIQACLEKKLLKFHFTKNQYGYFLNKTGKAVLIPFRTTCEKKSFMIGEHSPIIREPRIMPSRQMRGRPTCTSFRQLNLPALDRVRLNLSETKAFIQPKQLNLNHYHILLIYMIVGGIPKTNLSNYDYYF